MSSGRGKADVAAAIIAGGKASRLGGQVKALIEIEGRTILDHILEVVAPRVSALAISANDPTPYHGRDLLVIPDQTLGQGPLAGIAAALRWCRRPYLLVIGCDMPYVDEPLIELLLSRRAPGVDVIAPFAGGEPQPLIALYSNRVLPAVERRLHGGQLKAGDLVRDESLTLTRIYEDELRLCDPELRCLTNINAPEDLVRSRP